MPFFSDIPVLSFLFNRRGTYINRRNLLILVTARIVALEDMEPRDNLAMPEMPASTWTPVRPVEEAEPCEPPPCGCPPSGAAARPRAAKPTGPGY